MRYSNINFNLYRMFVEVYETKSFSKAAENLFCTQPAIGSAIRELETQLATKLFVTHTRGVEPTSTATTLYKVIQPALVELNHVEDIVKDINNLAAGQISFSCPSHIACFVLSDFFCEFRNKYPQIKLKICSASKNETSAMLARRNIEFAIDLLPLENDAFEIVNLAGLNYTFYTSKKYFAQHNLKQTLSKNDLERHPFIVPTKTSRTVQTLSKALKSPLNIMTETATSELGYSMVQNGCGIAYALEVFLDNNYQREEIIKLGIEGAVLPKATLVYAYYKNSLSKASQIFLKELETFCCR